MRVFKTISLVLGIYATSVVIELILVSSDPEYQGGSTILVILGFLAFLSPKVGYRWYDCFFAIIPFYGVYFIFKIAYRIANLPNRDWKERNIKNAQTEN